MNIEDTEQRHGIPAYPVRRYEWSYKEEPLRDRPAVKNSIKAAITGYPRLLKLARAINRTLVKGPKAAFQEIVFLGRSSRTLRKFDLLLISGGGQLTEAWGGPWCFPYTLFKWGLLARLCRVKCYYINVGAGPLEHPLSKFFVNRALRLADYVSFRDEDSRALVRRLGYRKSAEVAPDCAYSLNIAPAERFEEGAARPVVGFSPMAYCDPRFYWDKNQQAYERMRENLVRFGSWLISQNCQLRLFSTDIWFDVMVLDEVEAGLRQPGNVVHPEWLVRERAGQVRELMARIGGMDCVVTCRFHGVIFAHIMGKPVLALSHHPKVATLMRSLGLSEYCLDMRECDATILQEKFFLLMRNREAIALRMRESLAGYRAALTRQFDALFARDE
jgi:polysaccharide pyruvyl transferase WcaK-like protein